MEKRDVNVSLPKWAIKGLKKHFDVSTPELAAKMAIDEIVILLQEYRPTVFK